MKGRARSSRSSSSGPGRPDTLLVGTLGKPHGLRGELFVVVHSDDPDRFAPGATVHLSGDLTPLTVARTRSHTYRGRPRAVVSFEGVTDRAGAEALSGRDLVVPAERARPLEEGEYWDHQLIGCVVRTLDGEEVGEVQDLLHPPANDVLVVGTPTGEVLVPLVRVIVTEVDVEARRIVIDPIPGLID